jgi:hypothetical protein
MFGLFDRRPWVIEIQSKGLGGETSRLFGVNLLMSRREALRIVKEQDFTSPYGGRDYAVHRWIARPARANEVGRC